MPTRPKAQGRNLSVVFAALLTAGLLAAATPAHAVTSTSTQDATSDFESLAGAITGSAGDVTFDGAQALALGNAPDIVADFAVGIEAGGGTVIGLDVDQAAVDEVTSALVQARAGCQGQNNGTTQWYGWQLKIDSCKAAQLVASVSAGAGVATVAGLLTSWTGIGGISAGAIAAVLAAGAGFLAVCAAPGKGMILNLAWTGIPWCASQ
ncbi:hypothetical protein [Luethyella okanaganae]|uniref:Uncharacterized protein n=1 Tax=Luethyella okanaganae TaxID=69372 RepID=A0ABW1VJ69_9MICO